MAALRTKINCIRETLGFASFNDVKHWISLAAADMMVLLLYAFLVHLSIIQTWNFLHTLKPMVAKI